MAREISLAPTAAVAAAKPVAAPARVRRRRQLHLFSVATDAHEVSAGERRERGGGSSTSSVSPPMHMRSMRESGVSVVVAPTPTPTAFSLVDGLHQQEVLHFLALSSVRRYIDRIK
jgi:hypothetical protein